MLKEERQNKILEIIQTEGKATATALSKRLNVSEDTIRRDLREMDDNGWINRVHGGALPNNSGPLLFSDRHEEFLEEKMQLAKQGMKLIKDGHVLIIDGSTTNLQLVKAMPHNLRVTVITNSPVISIELSDHPLIKVIMLGGEFFKESLVNIGIPLIRALKNMKADLCFLGVHSFHSDFGMSVPHFEESLVKQQMLESANRTAILLTKSKLNTVSNYSIGDLSHVDYLIIDRDIASQSLKPYQKYDMEIIRA
ncbi:DeoR/GlpR family DNA-binding transcription regulator [Virgibacillus pantothenticus]|uniref:DeoR/GlpR family DNA-binding transcription regulator n=1 Tax=Virgibacillus pantothenticus TaxID=1473 RepID=UPI000987CEE4|nr:DeoR/GlpR family DNA-binding transcription regulator [Virgibacillus pantothenticus]